MVTPKVTPMTTANPATASDARDPQMTRLSTSRPDWSVPIQCAASGSISLSRMLTATGSWGAISGAKIEASTSRPAMQAPAKPAGPPQACTMRRRRFMTRLPQAAG